MVAPGTSEPFLFRTTPLMDPVIGATASSILARPNARPAKSTITMPADPPSARP